MTGALIAIIIAVAASLGSFIFGVNVGENKVLATNAKIQDVADRAAESMAYISADAIAAIEVTNKTIYQKATNEVRTNTVYSDCVNTDVMFNHINEALRGRKAGVDKSKLPGSGGADGKGLRVDGPKAD